MNNIIDNRGNESAADGEGGNVVTEVVVVVVMTLAVMAIMLDFPRGWELNLQHW